MARKYVTKIQTVTSSGFYGTEICTQWEVKNEYGLKYKYTFQYRKSPKFGNFGPYTEDKYHWNIPRAYKH